MGVIMGAVGKSPSIEKFNRMLQENSGQTVEKYIEMQSIGSEQEMRERYPKININLSVVGRRKGED